jgi:hypothetical protein
MRAILSVTTQSVIRRAEDSEAGEIARIVNAAFEVEREFRKGDRTSATEIAGCYDRTRCFPSAANALPDGLNR